MGCGGVVPVAAFCPEWLPPVAAGEPRHALYSLYRIDENLGECKVPLAEKTTPGPDDGDGESCDLSPFACAAAR